MPDSIEIWRSETGIDADDFTLVSTVSDGAPWGYVDTDVLIGHTYIYKARRYSADADKYSDFSGFLYASAPWSQGEFMVGDTATGIQSKLGIGHEDTKGTPNEPTQLLDRVSGTLDMTFNDPDHEILAGITTDMDSVPGTSEVAGTVRITLTPEGFTPVVCGMLGYPTSTPTTGPPAYVDHVWLDNFAQVPVTFTEVKGPAISVAPGAQIMGFTISVDKTQTTPIQSDLDVVAMNLLTQYANEAAVGLDTVGLDVLPAFGPAQALVTLNGVTSDECKGYTANFKINNAPRQVLNALRGPRGFIRKKTDLTLTLNMYFDTMAQYKAYFGVDPTTAGPFGASKVKNTVAVVLLLESETNAAAPNGFKNQVELTAPKCQYKKLGAPIQGPDEIMQAVELKAYHSTALGSCFKIRIRNSQSHSSIIAAGTPISAVPANEVNELVVS